MNNGRSVVCNEWKKKYTDSGLGESLEQNKCHGVFVERWVNSVVY